MLLLDGQSWEYTLTEFCNADLVYVHHVGFGDFARGAGEQLISILQDHGIDRGLVIDLDCGSGIWARRLLHAGYEVLGIDVAAEMLALAQKHAPGAHLEQSSAYDFNPPECQVITALGEVLGYGSEGYPQTNRSLSCCNEQQTVYRSAACWN